MIMVSTRQIGQKITGTTKMPIPSVNAVMNMPRMIEETKITTAFMYWRLTNCPAPVRHKAERIIAKATGWLPGGTWINPFGMNCWFPWYGN